MKTKSREARLKPGQYSELLETADLVGEFIQYWGFKKVQGRIWACLFLMNSPLNSRQLADLLEISSALVSISVAELLKFQVILEAGKGRNGVLLYQANPEVGAVIVGVLRNREQKLLARIHSSTAKLRSRELPKRKNHVALDANKIRLIGEWTKLAQSFLETGIEFVEASL